MYLPCRAPAEVESDYRHERDFELGRNVKAPAYSIACRVYSGMSPQRNPPPLSVRSTAMGIDVHANMNGATTKLKISAIIISCLTRCPTCDWSRAHALVGALVGVFGGFAHFVYHRHLALVGFFAHGRNPCERASDGRSRAGGAENFHSLHYSSSSRPPAHASASA